MKQKCCLQICIQSEQKLFEFQLDFYGKLVPIFASILRNAYPDYLILNKAFLLDWDTFLSLVLRKHHFC